MDGTLVDTEPYWMQTERALAAEYGAEWTTEDGLALVGNDLITSGRYIRDRMGLELSPEEIVDRLLDGVVARVQSEVPWRPGAVDLLGQLAAAGIPCALVTMSYQRFVEPILDALPPQTFAEVVTGDMVDNGKPHPEPYLTAAANLGLDPADCLAIEDSNTGIRSAVAAGCAVIGVEAHVPLQVDLGHLPVESLTGLDVAAAFSAASQIRGLSS